MNRKQSVRTSEFNQDKSLMCCYFKILISTQFLSIYIVSKQKIGQQSIDSII